MGRSRIEQSRHSHGGPEFRNGSFPPVVTAGSIAGTLEARMRFLRGRFGLRERSANAYADSRQANLFFDRKRIIGLTVAQAQRRIPACAIISAILAVQGPSLLSNNLPTKP